MTSVPGQIRTKIERVHVPVLPLFPIVIGWLITTSAFAIEPHRAAYRLSLDPAKPTTSGIDAVDGILVLEWREHCDQWHLKQQLAFDAFRSEQFLYGINVTFSAIEDKSGETYQFLVERDFPQSVTERFIGKASREESGEVIVEFSEPPMEQTLPVGTVFPMAHFESVFERFVAGETGFHNMLMFDGSGIDSLATVQTIISPLGTDVVDTASGEQELEGGVLSMAFFGEEQASETPDFTNRLWIDTEGIVHEVALDYPDFRLVGAPLEVDLFDPPQCN